MDKLKPLPCPFCGSAPAIVADQWGGQPRYWVVCVNRACDEGCKFADREYAIAAWNRRTPSAPVQPAGEVQPVAWRWKEYTGIADSPMIRYHEDCPQRHDIEELTPLYAAPIKEAAAPVQTMQGLAEFLRGLRSHSLYANASEKRKANISRWISEVEAARGITLASSEKDKPNAI